jgi:dihydrofolate synthase/folylpolyglutamate synthase
VARASGASTSTVEGVAPPPIVGLEGEHQKGNARVAAVLGSRVGASPEAVKEGIARARWPGRLERIGRFLLDAAHNPDGAEALARYLRSLALRREDVALVFGTLADKDWGAMLDTLAPLAATRVYIPPHAGARQAASADAMRARHAGTAARSVEEALSRFAVEGRDLSPALVVVAGSLVLVGAARSVLLGLPRDPPVAL